MRAGISVVVAVLVAVTVGASAGAGTAQQPGPRQAASEGAPAISGPAVLTFGESAVYGVNFAGDVTSHQWDLDGSGAFATDTGATPSVRAKFPRPGTFTIRVRGGGQELTKEVTVGRPTIAGLEYSPALPQPGQKVSFNLKTRSEQGFDPVYYSWKIKGLKPKNRTLTLKRPASSRASGQAGQQSTYKIELTGDAEPTAQPTLSRTFTRAGIYRMVVSVVGADGARTTVESDIKVGSGRAAYESVFGRPRPSRQPTFCSVAGGTQCGAISVQTNPTGVDEDVTFTNATPDFNWCVEVPVIKGNATNVGRIKLARAYAKLDLPYPSPELFFDNPAVNNQNAFDDALQQNANQQNGRRARAAQFNVEKETVCKRFTSEAVQWDLGDGTKIGEATTGTIEDPVRKAYPTKGTRTIKLTARRFYFDLTKFPNPNDEEAFAEAAMEAFQMSAQELIDAGILKSYLVYTQTQLRVYEKDCDGMQINGIPIKAYTVLGSYYSNPLDASGTTFANACFLNTEGGNWQPEPGALVSLNGVQVEPPAGDTVLVNLPAKTLTALNGSNLTLTFWNQNTYGNWDDYQMGSTPQIVVPGLTHDAELDRDVALLDNYAGANFDIGNFGGFVATGARVMLSPNSSALARISFQPPAPLNGATPVVVLGGHPTRARAIPGGSDFSMDLKDINIGPFRTKSFQLGHYPGDGWKGGGNFEIDLGPFNWALDAEYFPPTGLNASKCSELGSDKGPSGLSIRDDGSFDFAGGAIKGEIATIGPLGIDCFGAWFQQSPFILGGYIGGHIPPGTNFIGVDVCVNVAILEQGDFHAPCGELPILGYTARNGDEVFVAGRGIISLLDEIDLATGGFDVHAGADIIKTSAFGRVNVEFDPFWIEGGVKGTIVLAPNEGFEFLGDISLGMGPVSVGVKGIVSSKGIGACADVLVLSAGFVYRWGGDLDVFGGCNWGKFSSIRVSKRMVQRSDLRAPIGSPPLATVSAADVNVDAGRAVSFKVEGVDGAPNLTITAPDGRVIKAPTPDPRKPFQCVQSGLQSKTAPCRGVGFLTITPTGHRALFRGVEPDRLTSVPQQTIVTIPNPVRGRYRIDTQEGSAPIREVLSSTKTDARRVTARVTGSGADRKLDYFVKAIPGQSVEFLEEGAGVGRKLGAVAAGRGGSGRVRFPAGYGLRGTRKIFAIISQDGIPVARIEVAGYTAPSPPRVAPPSGLQTTRSRTGQLRACWQSVAKTERYEVSVVSTDGRVLRSTTTKRCATFSGFDESVGATVTVEAVTAWGTSFRPARSLIRKKAVSQQPVIVKM